MIEARMRYSFRVFAAIYGHQVVEKASCDTICCCYGTPASSEPGVAHISIPTRYRLPQRSQPSARPAQHRFADEDFPLFFGVDDRTGQPDWLGEIFEWLSSSQEMSSTQRDAVGRIPLSETPFTRHGLSPREPHALKIMAWLEGALQNGRACELLPKPASPVSGMRHLLICSHDIDFYYTDKASLMVRLLKNLVIAFHIYRSWDFFRWNVARILKLLLGKTSGAYLPALVDASESHDFQATLFVVSRHLHRRDPNYSLQEMVPVLLQSRKRGFSIGLHGSYESIIEREELGSEVAPLRDALNEQPQGGRQHYLRFDYHENLFSAVERAGLFYDSTLGFADTVGFRNGASFAFPPYDFKRERAHNFLEIPLVLMDGGLEATCRSTGEDPGVVAEEVLRASRRWGWGGVAIDWHNPIEPIQVPPRVNDVFWQCLRQKESYQERWMGGDQFLRACLSRYQAAGLLEGVRIDA